MLHLAPFSMTWDGDWTLFGRMAEGFIRDTGLSVSPLNAPDLRTRLVHPAQDVLLRKLMQGRECVGFLCCRMQGRAAELLALRIHPEKRRQGLGHDAVRTLERELRLHGVDRLTLAPAGNSAPFWCKTGFTALDGKYTREVPRYAGSAPCELLLYTRQPMHEDIYAPKLAHSVHFALIENGVCTALNHNSGIVYASADPGDDGVLYPHSLESPWLARQENGSWLLLANRTEADGSPDPDENGCLLRFASSDLLFFDELISMSYDDEDAQELLERYPRLPLPDLTGLDLPEGCIPGCVVAITEEEAKRLRTRFTTPVNVSNTVPEEIVCAAPADLEAVRAIAGYSDGSMVFKRVDWDTRAVDWTKPGRYAVRGRIHQDRYEFPMAWSKADPAVCRWEGKYYFISTNDLDGNHTLFIREADSLPGLVTAQQTCILDTTMYPHLGSLLWAPEMHIIGDRLFIFHAGTPGPFGQEQSHVMALKPGGNPTCAADWEMPRRVVKKDGSMLYDKGITLDMTVFHSGGRLYAAWSQRQFDPVDTGAWLYVAEIDPEKPWQLLSDPVVLAWPGYGWENNHTFVVEGPFALYHDGRILLTYSGALVDSTYAVGMLSIEEGADPLHFPNWRKENFPLLTSRSVPGEYGPGHNAYVTDEDGLVWNTYHARPGIRTEDGRQGFGPRSSGIRRVHFAADGFPHLDMTEEMDLDPKLAWVSATVVVE